MLFQRVIATPAGFEPGPRSDRKPKRCADLHKYHAGLRVVRWGPQRSLGNVRNPVVAVQMGPQWARGGPATRWGRRGANAFGLTEVPSPRKRVCLRLGQPPQEEWHREEH
jgi:hypothetical protein